MSYQIYTDGSCLVHNKNRKGGWGVIILKNNEAIRELSGSTKHTTNNREELTAVIEGLKKLPIRAKVEVRTDSMYVINGASIWIDKWVNKNFVGIKNDDLWRELKEELIIRNVSWKWVKGHSGVVLNERADKLATEAASKQIFKDQYLGNSK